MSIFAFQREKIAKTGIVSSIILILTIFSMLYAPGLLSSFFDGPDGSLWVRPFFLWVGFVAFLYGVAPAFIRRFEYRSEQYVAGACLLFFLSLFLFVGVQRLTSGLRYIEVYNEIMSQNLLAGKNIYADPEQSPVGTIYTPLFFIICSFLYKLFPVSFSFGRVVSIGATLLTAYLVYTIILKREKRLTTAIWAATLFVGTYAIMGTFYDQCYVDSLLMGLTTLSLYFLLQDTSRSDMFALLVAGAACFTKQTALFPFLVVLWHCLLARRKMWVLSPLLIWAVAGLLLVWFAGGWAITYLITYPSGHGFRLVPPLTNLYQFFLFQIPLWIGAIRYLIERKDARFNTFFIAVLGMALFGIFKEAGWTNALLPFEPVLCIAAATFLCRYKIALFIQLLLGIHNPFAAIYPWGTIRTADTEIVNIVKSTSEAVWLPMETHLYQHAKKEQWDNIQALIGPGYAGYPPPKRLLNALETKQFKSIIIRKNSMKDFHFFDPKIRKLIKKHYVKREGQLLVQFDRKES